jgi:hypothetical protein
MVRDGIGPLPDAVAAHAPSDVICSGFDARQWRDEGDPGWKVWDPAERAWTWRGVSDALKPTKPIEIARYEGSIFISHGTSDKAWSVEMTRRLEARLVAWPPPGDKIPGGYVVRDANGQALAYVYAH